MIFFFFLVSQVDDFFKFKNYYFSTEFRGRVDFFKASTAGEVFFSKKLLSIGALLIVYLFIYLHTKPVHKGHNWVFFFHRP